MRNFLTYILTAAVLLGSQPSQAYSFWNPFKKKAEEPVEKKEPAKKKTPYEKFTAKKGLLREDGFITIFKDKEDIWLEIPDSLLGREVVISNFTTENTSAVLGNWNELSKMNIFRIAATDSLLLFQKPQAPGSANPDATVMSFPIKYRGKDTTSFVVKATKVFDLSSEDNVKYKGSYGESMTSISKTEFRKEMSLTKRLLAGKNYVGLEREATFGMKVSVMGFEDDAPNFTANMISLLALLPRNDMPHKVSDSRIGTRNTEYIFYDEEKGKDSDLWINRWDLRGDKAITVYVDTLFSPVLSEGIRKGLMAWNEAFVQAGLGEKIKVEPLGRDIDAFDPLNSIVKYSGGRNSNVSANLLTAGDGEILSARISIPGNFYKGVLRQGMLTISDVDTRFATFNIGEDAVADVLGAELMGIMGQCLGLAPNYAGSYAYTPSQLRNPEFTRLHGITASVTDDVTFNYLSRPGDRERGVTIISDKVGEYDKYAIAWIYGSGVPDNKPEHFYSDASYPYTDYRAMPGDLGNDIFTAVSSGESHVKYAADHLVEWIADSGLDAESKSLYVDYVWMKFTDYVKLPARLIGALKIGEVREGYPAGHLGTLPKDIQKKALEAVFQGYRDVSFMDGNKALLTLSGLNKNVSGYTTMYSFQLGNTYGRLANVAYAHDFTGSDYAPDEFLSDMRKCVMRNAEAGRLDELEEISVGLLIQFLTKNCDVAQANYNLVTRKAGFALEEGDPYSLRMNLRTTVASYASEYDLMCYNCLKDVEKALVRGMSKASDAGVKKKLEYLLFTARAALYPEK